MPKVSVIVPVYGVEKYVERCSRSLFSQTLQDIEIIFVDDCSPDDSINIIKRTLEDYPYRRSQVKFYQMPNNSGLPLVRREGIRLATGEYIAHCDSDDWVESFAYEHLYSHAKKADYDIVYGDYYNTDGRRHKYVKQRNTSDLMLGPVWNKLVKSSLYKENEIQYPTENKGEDGALMIQLSYYAKSIGYISEAIYYYYYNPDSICHVPTEKAILKRHFQECKNLDLSMEFLRSHGVLSKYSDYIVSIKLSARRNLLPLIGNKYYYEMWTQTYPEINRKVMLCPKVKLKSKIGFVVVRLGLYPFLNRILRWLINIR